MIINKGRVIKVYDFTTPQNQVFSVTKYVSRGGNIFFYYQRMF